LALAALRDRWLRWNGASNRLYYRLTRRPHRFDLYKRLVTEVVARSRGIVQQDAA